jgi:hypothetical protein
MSNKHQKTESPLDALTSESARQRWELFHRAIAKAKEANNASLVEGDLQSGDPESASPLLTIVR